MNQRRTAFFVSDGTGITAEMLGHSLLTQFAEAISLQEITLPFVDTPAKAQAALLQINAQGAQDNARPVVFSTLVNADIAKVVSGAEALFLDCFDVFIAPLERELGVPATHAIGKSHSASNVSTYLHRIDAVNYSLSHDDGVSTRDLSEADIILTGVSRCGKTPTCLYLAMQFGIRAANYPLIPEDFAARQLPGQLRTLRKQIYGLTIAPTRLAEIRSQRRPHSQYAALSNCEFEIREAETLMRHAGIPFLDATSKSVEELSTTILQEAKLARRIY